MATIITTPNIIAFGKNKMPVTLKQTGVQAQNLSIEIDFSISIGNNNEVIEINFDEETVQFTLTDSPAGANKLHSDSSTLTNKVGENYDIIKSNWLINKHFQVFLTNNVIYLFSRAKKDHSASVAGPNIAILWTGGMSHSVSFGVGVEVSDGLEFVPSNYDKLFPVDDTGVASFNIKDAFDLGFDTPSNTIVSKSENGAKTYRIAHYQTLNGETQSLERTGEMLVINGASEKENNDWFGLPSFLTTFESKQVTRKESPQWVSFANTADYNDVIMLVTYINTDGNVGEFEVQLGDLELGLYCVAVGYEQLNLSQYGEIKEYNIKIVYGSNNSVFRTFYIDTQDYNNVQTFVFHNSKGGYDTIICTGETEFKTSFSAEEAERVEGGYSIIQKYNSEIGYTYKQYSGYLRSRKEQNKYDELLLSEKVWIVNDGQLSEIFITSKSNQKSSTNNDLFSTDFEFTSIHNEKTIKTS